MDPPLKHKVIVGTVPLSLVMPPAGNCPWIIAQELCESRGGRPGLPVPNSNSHYCLCGCQATSEFRSCVKVEVAVLMSLMVSVDVKQHWTMLTHWSQFVPVNRHPRTLSSTSSSSVKQHWVWTAPGYRQVVRSTSTNHTLSGPSFRLRNLRYRDRPSNV